MTEMLEVHESSSFKTWGIPSRTGRYLAIARDIAQRFCPWLLGPNSLSARWNPTIVAAPRPRSAGTVDSGVPAPLSPLDCFAFRPLSLPIPWLPFSSPSFQVLGRLRTTSFAARVPAARRAFAERCGAGHETGTVQPRTAALIATDMNRTSATALTTYHLTRQCQKRAAERKREGDHRRSGRCGIRLELAHAGCFAAPRLTTLFHFGAKCLAEQVCHEHGRKQLDIGLVCSHYKNSDARRRGRLS